MREAKERRACRARYEDESAEDDQADPARRRRRWNGPGHVHSGQGGERALSVVEGELTVVMAVGRLAALDYEGERQQQENRYR